MFSPYFNVPLYTTSNNSSATITYYSVAFVQAGSFIGRGASGFLADAFGVWNIFVASGLSLTVTLLAFWTGVPLPDAVVVIGIFTYGIASGAWIALVAASCAAISPTREFGMRLGMLWSSTALLQTFGPVICGGESFVPAKGESADRSALVTQGNNTFTYAAIFCAIAALIGTAITIAPRILEIVQLRSASKSQEIEEHKADKSGRTTPA